MNTKKYLLNINSRKIHLAASTDGRCKISNMREEYKVYFDVLSDAIEYPNSNARLATKCAFCLKNN